MDFSSSINVKRQGYIGNSLPIAMHHAKKWDNIPPFWYGALFCYIKGTNDDNTCLEGFT